MGMKYECWLWPDKRLVKAEARAMREEHNEVVNAYYSLRDKHNDVTQERDLCVKHLQDAVNRWAGPMASDEPINGCDAVEWLCGWLPAVMERLGVTGPEPEILALCPYSANPDDAHLSYVLARNHKGEYVTWVCTDLSDGRSGYSSGHYFSADQYEEAVKDFLKRCEHTLA